MHLIRNLLALFAMAFLSLIPIDGNSYCDGASYVMNPSGYPCAGYPGPCCPCPGPCCPNPGQGPGPGPGNYPCSCPCPGPGQGPGCCPFPPCCPCPPPYCPPPCYSCPCPPPCPCSPPCPCVEEPCCPSKRPLQPCGRSFVIKGGVAPSRYSNRGNVFLTIPAFSEVISLNIVPKFSNQFKLPWTGGLEFAFNISNHVQLFFEYAHSEANGDIYRYTTSIGNFTETTTSFEMDAGYLGARYYFDNVCSCCCRQSRAAPYVGFKTGVAFQKHVLFDLSFNDVFVATNPYWLEQTVVSGGLQMGIEWWWCDNLSVILQGELVGTQGFRPNRNVILDPTLAGGISNMTIGDTRWIVSWPLTLGLRYAF